MKKKRNFVFSDDEKFGKLPAHCCWVSCVSSDLLRVLGPKEIPEDRTFVRRDCPKVESNFLVFFVAADSIHSR